MSEMPERIAVASDGFWMNDNPNTNEPDDVIYIRADLVALKDERIAQLETELEEVQRNGKLIEGWFAIEKKKRVEFEKGLTLWRGACHRYQDRQEALVAELAEMATKRAEAEADAMGAVSDLCKLTALVLRGRDEGSVTQDDIRKALEAVLTLRSNLVFAEMNVDSFKALAGEVQVENERLKRLLDLKINTP